jgi:hypothetical protein
MEGVAFGRISEQEASAKPGVDVEVGVFERGNVLTARLSFSE